MSKRQLKICKYHNFISIKAEITNFFDHLGFLFSGSWAGPKYYTDLNSSLTEKVNQIKNHTINKGKMKTFVSKKSVAIKIKQEG